MKIFKPLKIKLECTDPTPVPFSRITYPSTLSFSIQVQN